MQYFPWILHARDLLRAHYSIRPGCGSCQYLQGRSRRTEHGSKEVGLICEGCRKRKWEVRARWMMARWSQGTRRRQQQKGGEEVWLTICILFRGYQGTWLNPVRLNPLGEHCCRRPSRKPFTGTRSLLFTGLHLYSCWGWVIEEEERERERKRERGTQVGLVQPSICYSWAQKFSTAAKIAHLTWPPLIPFACDSSWVNMSINWIQIVDL